MKSVFERSLELHDELKGKMSTELKAPLEDGEDLSLMYSPGVAEPCRKIHEDKENVYKYTSKANTVAVISDGSAVLGLGNIGPEAALPVMEGKAALFKKFAGVNAVPIVIDIHDEDGIVNFVKNIAPTFGGINLEDISAPKCIEIEKRLIKDLDIPVFHDDQHGTAIVVIAGLVNALKLVDKTPEEVTVVISGVGAAGSSIIKMLVDLGIGKIYGFNSQGILNKRQDYDNALYAELADLTNPEDEELSFEEAMAKADVFIGVSVKDKVSKEMVKNMKKDSIIFAMANPDPEITYDDARDAGARVVGTGRSDFPNQVNNVLAFPGLFKGALEVGAKKITNEMKMAAALAIANLIEEKDLREDYVIPSPFDERVADAVAKAVGAKAIEDKLTR